MEVQELQNTRRMIQMYIRKSHGQAVGVLVAIKHEDGITLGWSQCNKVDRFDKVRGTQIAVDRAIFGSGEKLAHKVQKFLPKFQERAAKYFKVPLEEVTFLGRK